MTKIHSYAGYEQWKGWNTRFRYTTEDADYFQGEMRGVKIGDGDLLEIGFGSGSFIAWARDQGARVSGTEINPRLLDAAQVAGINTIPSDIETVAQEYADSFDTIVAFDVFEHFETMEVVSRLRACEVMLRAGGHLVMRFPNGQSPFGNISQYGDASHCTALSRQVVEQLVLGMRFRSVRYGPPYPVRGATIEKRVARALRYSARAVVSAGLNFIYAADIPWDPVVVLVLKKQS